MSDWRENKGRQPVKDDTLVIVHLNGLTSPSKPLEAGKWRWSFSRIGYGDIERWRRA